ncbi:MAG: TolC family protein [Chlorobium sp.]|uniref:TolC family protein n=1 Tax=Chlorobium sp. TaxID=1095 RepID=UPI002F42C9A8
MNRFVLSLVSFVLLLISFALHPRGATAATDSSRYSLTLDDAVRLGLSKSRALELARLDREMASGKIRETWSEVLPQLTTSFTYTRTLKPSVLFFPDVFSGSPNPNSFIPLEISADNSASATLDLRQKLFDGSAIAGIRAASVVRKISDESYRNTRSAVVADIKQAYFDALISRDRLQLIRQSIERWELAQRDTRAMFRQGIAADIDTLQAFLSVENLRPDLIQAENMVGITMTKLKNAMGIPSESDVTLTGRLEVLPSSYPAQIAEASQEALLSRPDLRQLELQVEAEDQKVFSARSERFPVLSAFGQLQAQTAFNDDVSLADSDWPVSAAVGLQVSMPIFTGFRIGAKVEQARISRLQVMTRLADLKANIRAEIEVRLSAFNEARKRIEVQSKTISVAERSYRISQLRFREGIGSRLELIDAELQLNKAKTNYLQAVYDYLMASVLLDRALGRSGAPAELKG